VTPIDIDDAVYQPDAWLLDSSSALTVLNAPKWVDKVCFSFRVRARPRRGTSTVLEDLSSVTFVYIDNVSSTAYLADDDILAVAAPVEDAVIPLPIHTRIRLKLGPVTPLKPLSSG